MPLHGALISRGFEAHVGFLFARYCSLPPITKPSVVPSDALRRGDPCACDFGCLSLYTDSDRPVLLCVLQSASLVSSPQPTTKATHQPPYLLQFGTDNSCHSFPSDELRNDLSSSSCARRTRIPRQDAHNDCAGVLYPLNHLWQCMYPCPNHHRPTVPEHLFEEPTLHEFLVFMGCIFCRISPAVSVTCL